MTQLMVQSAPYPEALAVLVDKVSYRPGWKFRLEDMQRDDDHGRGTAGGLTLIICTKGYNSYHPDQGENYCVNHYRIVPAATYDERAWRWWLFEQLLEVERHEAAEFFAIDGVHPYPPNHGPGRDPYQILEYGTDEDAAMSYLGVVNAH